MNARKIPFLLFLFVIFLIPFSAEATGDQTNPNLFPVTVAKNIDPGLIDAINEGDSGGEIGLALIGSDTTVGYYKKCATDAYFYFIVANNSGATVGTVLPRWAKIDGQAYFTDSSAFLCKELPASATPSNNFADADSGSACTLQNNQLMVGSGKAVSVRGKIVNFSHELTRGNEKDSDPEYLHIDFYVQINNSKKQGQGALESKGSLCDGLNFLPVTPHNYVDGGYFIDPSGRRVCSMNYFFIVENPDQFYSTVVELPRWVELDEQRFNVGCKYLYPGCKVSGFRHYAWAILDEDDTYIGPKYYFCDQDRAVGNNCYEENSLWWLRVPPNTKISVRGMVNNLCNVPAANPLQNSELIVGFDVSDAGSNKWWLDGIVEGTESRDLANSSKDINFIDEPSRLEDRDKDEPVDRYLLEDPSLVNLEEEAAQPIIIEETSEP